MPNRNERPSAASEFAREQADELIGIYELEGIKDHKTAIDFTDLNLHEHMEQKVLKHAAQLYALEAGKPAGWKASKEEVRDMRQNMMAYRNLTSEGGYVIELPVELDDDSVNVVTFVIAVDGRDMVH